MILVNFGDIHIEEVLRSYSDYIKYISTEDFDKNDADWYIRYIEVIKSLSADSDIIITPFSDKLIMCLNSLALDFTLVVAPANLNLVNDTLQSQCDNLIQLEGDEDLLYVLREILKCSWIPQDDTVVDLPIEVDNSSTNVATDLDVAMTNKNKLTLKQLIESDVDITESDVHDLKATTNKLKVAMLLQAKSRLNTVLKLSTILDKLYAELIDRIDCNLDSTDTASLLYTAEQISKALSETNQFIMSLITNEKIQNFFIIDNSKVINVNDDRVDINKREKIRKAAEIVIDNIDYFVKGDLDNIKNPNV